MPRRPPLWATATCSVLATIPMERRLFEPQLKDVFWRFERWAAAVPGPFDQPSANNAEAGPSGVHDAPPDNVQDFDPVGAAVAAADARRQANQNAGSNWLSDHTAATRIVMQSISKLLQAVGNRGVSGLRFRGMNQVRLDSLHLHARRLAIYKQSGKPRLSRQTAALVVARAVLYEMSGNVNQSIEEHQGFAST